MMNKLLAALDGSDRADGVFRYAAALAEALGASIHLLSVVAMPPEPPPARAEAHLRTFAVRAPHLHIEVIVRESTQPWRAIIDVADEIGADLILVGSHGYHGARLPARHERGQGRQPGAPQRPRRAPPAQPAAAPGGVSPRDRGVRRGGAVALGSASRWPPSRSRRGRRWHDSAPGADMLPRSV